MTTTLSIDMVTTIPDATAVCATPSPAAQAVAPDAGVTSRQAMPEDFSGCGGLAGLVSDNAALGEALQTLVDALDMPQQIEADVNLVVAAEGKPAVAVDPMLVAAANLKPTVTGDVPVVADKPVARGEPGVFVLPHSAVTVGGGFQPPRMKVEDLASAAEAPAVVAEPPAAADKPVVAGVTSKPKATADTSETVILQAASAVSAPLAESVAPVRETAVSAVSAVSRVAPIDVSDMFLAAAEEVAAAVRVSPALMRGEAGEIRVQLRSDVLEGTEVVVAVDGKKMDVTFVPTVTHVADTVAANQLLVQQQLAAKIVGFEISVAVAQTVATNVSVGVASSASAQTAVARERRTNGRA